MDRLMGDRVTGGQGDRVTCLTGFEGKSDQLIMQGGVKYVYKSRCVLGRKMVLKGLILVVL